MIRQEYIDFVENFERLNPYELDNLSREIHKHYKSQKRKKILKNKDIQDILISAMHGLQIKFAEDRVEDAKSYLSQVKSKIL